MTFPDTDEIRSAVQQRYAQAARDASSCCGGAPCDGVDPFGQVQYLAGDRDLIPEEALVASLGCGNPTQLIDLNPGEVVLDLGSGGGIDVLLSARRVGPTGKVYGLDMTPEMLELARANQAKSGLDNVEFLLGTIEDIPLPDDSVDVVISNCVVNLSGDKDRVFREAFRVLRPGGRLAISDILLSRPLPEELNEVTALWTGCITGALTEADCLAGLAAAGFTDASIQPTTVFDRASLEDMSVQLDPDDTPAGLDIDAVLADLDGVIRSAFIRAVKPGSGDATDRDRQA